jgi:hypothetical protein
MLSSPSDDLDDIPGLGPARRATLAAAGLASRAALQSITLEQLIAVTGMPRAKAATVIATLHEPKDAHTSSPPTDEAYPEAAIIDPASLGGPPPSGPTLPDDDQSPAMAAQAALDRAAVRLQSAVADMTRRWQAPEIERRQARLIAVLDTLIGGPELRPKTARKLAVRLDAVTARIEKWFADERPLTPRRLERVRELLRQNRKRIELALGTAGAKSDGSHEEADGEHDPYRSEQ